MIPQLMRFGLVGLLGSAVNLAVFYLASAFLQLAPNLAATLAFLVAVSHNYTLNRAWTFHLLGQQRVAYVSGWTKYVLINLVGFGINLVVLNAAIFLKGADYSLPGQALGILSGMVFNFALSKLLVFKHAVARWQ